MWNTLDCYQSTINILLQGPAVLWQDGDRMSGLSDWKRKPSNVLRKGSMIAVKEVKDGKIPLISAKRHGYM